METRVGREVVSIWWDHRPSLLEKYKIKWQGIVNVLRPPREVHGCKDTMLIIVGKDRGHMAGPSRDIRPLTREQVMDRRVRNAMDAMGLQHVNYVDLSGKGLEQRARERQ